jgi:hypothetical protein
MNRVRIYTKWLLLPASIAVLLYFHAQTAWWHWHLLPNGNLVGHAHPFHSDKSSYPFQQHHHSHNQLSFFSQFSSGSATVNEVNPFVFDACYFQLEHQALPCCSKPHDICFGIPLLRAPPSFIFS